MAFSYDAEIKEPWQIEFEKEPIDDDQWNCIVTAVVESKPGDEECLRIFSQSIISSINSSIHIINMSELIRMFKQDRNLGETENKFQKGKEKLNTGKVKEKNTDELVLPLPRFREILSLISKYAIYSDGQCILPPKLMAYALKYIILYKKDTDHFLRKTENFNMRKKREAEIREEIIKNFEATLMKKPCEEQCKREIKEENTTADTNFVWTRSKFDLLGNSVTDGPFNGPEIYVILSEFYNPFYFIELLKINIPLTAVIKTEDNYSSIGRNVTTKKLETINSFWIQMEKMVSEKETTDSWKDVAMLKFSVPRKDSHVSAEGRNAAILEDLTAVLYSVFHLKRLHQRYIEQMKVHRMIESLEPLDLSKCLVYTNLCDILIEDNFNIELFLLFGIIEQVVAGVPQTKFRAHEYVTDPSDNVSAQQWENLEYKLTPKSDTFIEEEYMKGFEFGEFHFSEKFLANILKDKSKKLDESKDQGKSPSIYFYGDSISPRTFNVDQRIIKPREIYERFLKNFMSHKIWKKFPKISLAERAWCEYQFFRLCKISKETEESLRVKLFFATTMKLIGNSKSFIDEHVSDESSVSVSNNSKEQDSEHIRLILSKPQFFKDIVNIFYHHKNSENFIGSSKENLTLKKTEANSTLVSPLSSESDSSHTDGKESRTFEDTEDDTTIFSKLEKILDFQDISFLNEPSLFSDQKVFKSFINKYNFFEELEPNRMIQQLEQCYDFYNSIQYSYFSPTDTLVLLASNEVDLQGLSKNDKRGYLPTPLSLRDFCQYVLFENENWRKNEDAEYISFLEKVRENAQCETEKRNYEYKCCLLKKLYSMSESERINILRRTEETESTSKENNFEKKKNISITEENKKLKAEYITNVEKEVILNKEKAAEESISLKAKQPKQNKTAFYGINYGDLRVQVDEQSYQFHSKDGTIVSVKVEKWLYGKRLVSLFVEKNDASFTIHVSEENEMEKYFHFKNKSGTLITFSESKQLEDDTEKQFFLCTITCPSGLVVKPVCTPTIMYVKQTYCQPYLQGKDIGNEKFRCYLSNGQILIFRVNGTVDVLCPGGTRYTCYKFTKWEQEKNVDRTSDSTDETKENSETLTLTGEKFDVEKYDVLMPNGEFWIRNQKSKCKYLAKIVTVLAGKDPETEELFLRREDGMSCMLWQNGKLVTTYPDGSKITSIPKFEDEQIFINEKERLHVNGKTTTVRQSAEDGDSAFIKPETRFSTNDVPVKSDEGFTSVTCSYLLEHPKYATVHFVDSVPEIIVPEHIKMKVFPVGDYHVKAKHSELNIIGNTANFYSSCNRCGKKSTSKIFLMQSLSSDLLSEIQDFFDNKLFVYNTGKVLYESAQNSEHECLGNPESADSCSVVNAHRRFNTFAELFHPTIRNFFNGRCFVVHRDLSGLEFIDQINLAKYIARLSESAYYDLDQSMHKTTFKQHSFFEPLYKMGKERWLMHYRENDSFPITVKRSDIIPLNKTEFTRSQVRPTFPGKQIDAENIDMRERNRRPRIVIARFIRVLHTKPYNVIKEINLLVSLYQKIALDISNCYRIHSSKRKRCPTTKNVTKKLELIASTISQSMNLYPHTCTMVPYTDLDIHSAAHKLQLNYNIAQENDLRMGTLQKCTQIYNPLTRKRKNPDIPEANN